MIYKASNFNNFISTFSISKTMEEQGKKEIIIDLFLDYVNNQFPYETPIYKIEVKKLPSGEHVGVGFIKKEKYFSMVNYHPLRKGFQETHQLPLKTDLNDSIKETFKALERLFEKEV